GFGVRLWYILRPGPLITRIAWPKISRRRLTHLLTTHGLTVPAVALASCCRCQEIGMSSATPLDRIGVGIDTARYGHRVSFLPPDRQPAAKPLTVLESRAGYQALQERLEQLHQQHPQARFHVRIDAAGQYAANLEHFLRDLPLPLTLSVGEPKRNKDYQKAHFPK